MEEEGTALWEEIREVEITDGLFHVILGRGKPLNLPFDKPYWLGIEVEGEEELTPRYALTSSPYSLNALSTIVEPEAGQSFAIRDSLGEQTHILSQNGDVTHKGKGYFEGGLEVILGDTSGTQSMKSNSIDALHELTSNEDRAIYGYSAVGVAVAGFSSTNVGVFGSSGDDAGVWGVSSINIGVRGESISGGGVFGKSRTNNGVQGESEDGMGVFGDSREGVGVMGWGHSSESIGVYGKSETGTGVYGESDESTAVFGSSPYGTAVYGLSTDDVGVLGKSTKSVGVQGESTDDVGVLGVSDSENGVGVRGESIDGVGVYASSDFGTGLYAYGLDVAAEFEGDVLIEETGKLKIDNVPEDPQSEQFLVWSGDKFVKCRTLPSDTAEGHECGWEYDEESGIISTDHLVVIENAQGEILAYFNHPEEYNLIKERLKIDGWLFITDEAGKTGTIINEEGISVFDSAGGPAHIFNQDSSFHYKPESFYEDVILRGQDGKGIKLVNDSEETIAGFGRKDLGTDKILAVYGKAETENDAAGVFDGDVEVNGDLHVVSDEGDTVTSFYSDGTSKHKGLETYEAGIEIPIGLGKYIDINPEVGIAIRERNGGDYYFHADPDGNALIKEFLTVKNCFVSDVLQVQGILSKPAGSFKIDHPLDPENKFLYHSFVESPDMMNIYNGNVALDESGEAWVELPDWFGALNKDFRYQLTCIGGYAPVYVAEKIQSNRFQIAGGHSGLEVSWQVTGIRQDAYAEANRIQVEEDKSPEQRGTYLHPECFGKPESYRLSYKK
ncbi:MAG: hypothetical protein JSV84_12065 [Gemmatimonadota bacterium]|nr:MAG: hypothetical protein JSV84_12065 [Gemmatimonadota bacterium]